MVFGLFGNIGHPAVYPVEEGLCIECDRVPIHLLQMEENPVVVWIGTLTAATVTHAQLMKFGLFGPRGLPAQENVVGEHQYEEGRVNSRRRILAGLLVTVQRLRINAKDAKSLIVQLMGIGLLGKNGLIVRRPVEIVL